MRRLTQGTGNPETSPDASPPQDKPISSCGNPIISIDEMVIALEDMIVVASSVMSQLAMLNSAAQTNSCDNIVAALDNVKKQLVAELQNINGEDVGNDGVNDDQLQLNSDDEADELLEYSPSPSPSPLHHVKSPYFDITSFQMALDKEREKNADLISKLTEYQHTLRVAATREIELESELEALYQEKENNTNSIVRSKDVVLTPIKLSGALSSSFPVQSHYSPFPPDSSSNVGKLKELVEISEQHSSDIARKYALMYTRCKRQISLADGEIDGLNQLVDYLRNSNVKLQAEVRDLKMSSASLKHMQVDIEKLNQEREQKEEADKQRVALYLELADLRCKVDTLTSQLSEAQTQLKRYKTETSIKQQLSDDMTLALEKKTEECRNLDLVNTELKSSLAAMNARDDERRMIELENARDLELLRAAHGTLLKSHETASASLSTLKTEYQRLESISSEREVCITSLETNNANLAKQLHSMHSALNDTQLTLQEQESFVSSLRLQLAACQSNLTAAETSLREIQSQQKDVITFVASEVASAVLASEHRATEAVSAAYELRIFCDSQKLALEKLEKNKLELMKKVDEDEMLVASAEKMRGEMEHQCESLKSTIHSLTGDKEALEKVYSAALQQLATFSVELNEINLSHGNLQQDLNDSNEHRKIVEQRLTILMAAHKTDEDELERSQKECELLQLRAAAQQRDLDAKSSSHRELLEEQQAAVLKFQSSEHKQTELEERIIVLQTELDRSESLCALHQINLSHVERELDNSRAKSSQLEAHSADLAEQLKELEHSLSQSHSQTHLLQKQELAHDEMVTMLVAEKDRLVASLADALRAKDQVEHQKRLSEEDKCKAIEMHRLALASAQQLLMQEKDAREKNEREKYQQEVDAVQLVNLQKMLRSEEEKAHEVESELNEQVTALQLALNKAIEDQEVTFKLLVQEKEVVQSLSEEKDEIDKHLRGKIGRENAMLVELERFKESCRESSDGMLVLQRENQVLLSQLATAGSEISRMRSLEFQLRNALKSMSEAKMEAEQAAALAQVVSTLPPVPPSPKVSPRGVLPADPSSPPENTQLIMADLAKKVAFWEDKKRVLRGLVGKLREAVHVIRTRAAERGIQLPSPQKWDFSAASNGFGAGTDDVIEELVSAVGALTMTLPWVRSVYIKPAIATPTTNILNSSAKSSSALQNNEGEITPITPPRVVVAKRASDSVSTAITNTPPRPPTPVLKRPSPKVNRTEIGTNTTPTRPMHCIRSSPKSSSPSHNSRIGRNSPELAVKRGYRSVVHGTDNSDHLSHSLYTSSPDRSATRSERIDRNDRAIRHMSEEKEQIRALSQQLDYAKRAISKSLRILPSNATSAASERSINFAASTSSNANSVRKETPPQAPNPTAHAGKSANAFKRSTTPTQPFFVRHMGEDW